MTDIENDFFEKWLTQILQNESKHAPNLAGRK